MLWADLLLQAARLVRPGGWLGYATCSLLEVENGDRVAGLLVDNPDWTLRQDRRLTPLDGGDGFYMALLQHG